MASLSDLQFTQPVLQELFTNHELLHRETHRPSAEASKVRSVCILGGGTAGWMAALALRAQLPWLDVTVIESKQIPIIGVGEASVPSLVPFLHHYLKIDAAELAREVAPTWKQGIRFEWGLPGDYVFQAPFDWEVNGVGMLGSMAETGNVSAYTIQSILMAKDVTAVIRSGGKLQSLLPMLSFAYHLDNQRFVAYLTKKAKERGVHHREDKIKAAELSDGPGLDGERSVARLVTEGGESLSFDLYVDASGFRSFLLGGALSEPFQSFASSLFTDAAIPFNVPHGGKIKPYTTARTMDHGWCWNIPIMDSDHMGYVFSTAYTTFDEALAEAKRVWPNLTSEREVRFRSGRHDRMWVGNVFAIGNAYAFVEPLESTGLLMITRAITSLVRAFPIGDDNLVMKRFINATVGRDWDRLRWFLAAHYKFNKRLDTRFWSDVRANVDVSGLQSALDLYQAMGPLSLLPRAIRTSLLDEVQVFFYGLAGLDTILLGQKVPHAKIDREPSKSWRARRQNAMELARRALPQAEALREYNARPDWQEQLIQHPSSWVNRIATHL